MVLTLYSLLITQKNVLQLLLCQKKIIKILLNNKIKDFKAIYWNEYKTKEINEDV